MEKMNIPFFGVDRLYNENSTRIEECIRQVFSHGKVLMGPEVEEFEENIAKFCQRTYAVAVGSCTDALFFALKSAGVEKGDEVLVPAFSFIASVTPILRIGAIPVFVDIEPDYYMMDLEDFKQKITTKTKAVIGVHLFGQSLPIDELEKIAEENNLLIIEDAAQSLGSYHNSRMVGSMGISSCISFDPTKIIGAFGNGGILLTDNENIYKKVKQLHYHGKNPESKEFEILGFNSRMATFQAALLNWQLENIQEIIKKRQQIAHTIISSVNNSAISFPKVRANSFHTYHKFVLFSPERDQLKAYLEEQGIKTNIHYPKPLFEHSVLKKFPYKAERIKQANKICDYVLSLPIYPELKDEEINYMIQVINSFGN